jgi:uncharacterized protein (TIGR02246 family)
MVATKRRMSSTILFAVIILVMSVAPLPAQEKEKPSADEAEIRQAVKSYVEAFNKGDAAAVASLWADNGEYKGPSGESFKGRKKIEAFLKKFFAENKDVQIQASPTSLRFPSPNSAIEIGTATVSRPGQTPEESQYVASYTKRAGAWKLTSVKEDESPEVLPGYEHLKELGWLIGEWVDQDEDSTLETTYQWSKNKSFITGAFTVFIEGKADLQGTQIIGWDPAAKAIKSWVFDSKGGFGQGIWYKSGNQWISESTGTLSDGEKASAMNIYTYVDDNTFTFQSIGRQMGGELLPNVDEVVVVRKQPAEPQPRTSKQTR